MIVRHFYLARNFGFFAFQRELPVECWFFLSREQGRALLSRVEIGEAAKSYRRDIDHCELPEAAELDPLCIEGRPSESLSLLVRPMMMLLEEELAMVVHDEKEKSLLYFLLVPRTQDPHALVGLCDEKGNHAVFVIYSKKQGQQILQDYCSQVDRVRIAKAQKVLEESCLPKESAMSMVKIGEPMAIFLNKGYVLMCELGIEP